MVGFSKAGIAAFWNQQTANSNEDVLCKFLTA
jgi:hypothetical protein